MKPGLGKTEFLSVPDQNSEIGTDWKQPKAQKNRSHTGPILRKFSPILSDIWDNLNSSDVNHD